MLPALSHAGDATVIELLLMHTSSDRKNVNKKDL